MHRSDTSSAPVDPTGAPPVPEPLQRRPRRRLALAAVLVALAVAAACQPNPPPPAVKAFRFTGSGWGHGVGMSQYGALGMAEAGRSHTQILTTYYPGSTVVTRAPTDNLRVLVAERQPKLTFITGGTTSFGTGRTVPGGRTVVVTREGAGVRIGAPFNVTVPAFTINFSGVLRIAEAGHGYRFGRVAVRPDPVVGVRAVVTELTMNQYLYGVAEVPASWHTQALRAQAVAARTYAQRRHDSRAGSGLDFDLLSTVNDQVYAGTTSEHPRWTDAVNVTNAQFVTHGGALVNTVYSSSNGGHSEASSYVWGGVVPYLVARPDPYDRNAKNPNRAWTRTYTAAQLGSWFQVGTATGITINGNRGASGRIDRATVTVTGTHGRRVMTGNEFRTWINAINPGLAHDLLSTKFDVSVVK